jgi:hypothetical protein
MLERRKKEEEWRVEAREEGMEGERGKEETVINSHIQKRGYYGHAIG